MAEVQIQSNKYSILKEAKNILIFNAQILVDQKRRRKSSNSLLISEYETIRMTETFLNTEIPLKILFPNYNLITFIILELSYNILFLENKY